MSDPYAIWRAAEGLACRKTVEIVMPELAAALGGKAGPTLPQPPGTSAADLPVPQPACATCGKQWARLTFGDEPVCAMCLGQLPYAQQAKATRHAEWTNIGPLDRKRRR